MFLWNQHPQTVTEHHLEPELKTESISQRQSIQAVMTLEIELAFETNRP